MIDAGLMNSIFRKALCDGGVMITASHLPGDKNGIKFFTPRGGFEKPQIKTLISLAQQHSVVWYDQRAIPPTSGKDAVFCSEWVDWMPSYSSGLKEALVREVLGDNQDGGDPTKILSGLKLVLNSGNGSGGFFKSVLEDLGADTSACMHTEPDGNFPNGIPNPENPSMIEKTIQACEAANADLGILLDTGKSVPA
jgi:phosphomannomutase